MATNIEERYFRSNIADGNRQSLQKPHEKGIISLLMAQNRMNPLQMNLSFGMMQFYSDAKSWQEFKTFPVHSLN